jgi:hypothetical protein
VGVEEVTRAAEMAAFRKRILLGSSATIARMFNLGSPKTGGDWIVHIAGAFVALFLVWWMLRVFVL